MLCDGLTGIGCSKVPDINNVGLMEDRATLRISHNILQLDYHGIISKNKVLEIMKEMAKVVDKQNKGDKRYINMSDDYIDQEHLKQHVN